MVAWNETVDHALSEEGYLGRNYLGCERALERARVGEYELALAEADGIGSRPDLEGFVLLHLARVYSGSLVALEQDQHPPRDQRENAKRQCVAKALQCLRRARLKDPSNLAVLTQVEGDPLLASLRETADYQAWREEPGSLSASSSEASEKPDPLERAAACLTSARNARLGGQPDAAETMLRQSEAALDGDPRFTQRPPGMRLLADIHFEWAELEIGRDQLDQAIADYDQSIATLLELLHAEAAQPPELGRLLAERYRLKAWHLSRAGRAEALRSWDLAVEHAVGVQRLALRAERAIEYALLGDHARAVADADQIAADPAQTGDTMVWLARVYSSAIDAVASNGQLDSTQSAMLREHYASRGVACLRRADSDAWTTPNRLAELDADWQLETLRRCQDYIDWRQKLNQRLATQSDDNAAFQP